MSTSAFGAVSSIRISTGQYSMPAVLGAFAPFTIGALAVIEMIAHWGFGAQAGWLGVIGSGCSGAVLTFLFRDRLKKKP